MRDSRTERLRMMINKNTNPGEPNELELWLGEMEDYKFKHGEMFELYYRKTDTATQAQVETVLDEMVQLKYVNLSNDSYNQN